MSSRACDKEKEKIYNRDPNLNGPSNDEKLNFRFLNFLENGIDKIQDNYLAIIKKIHVILADCSDLTDEQKLDYCNIERYFIKLYLKESIL